MQYYPVNLDLNNRGCLVVGGGSVAFRKVSTLVKCGAIVTVVSPKVNEDIRRTDEENTILLKVKKYESLDILNQFLVIGATNDKAVNFKISEDTKKHGILCNIVDEPKICNFILPSIVERGDFTLAISTSGKSPAFAKKLRKELENKFGIEYGKLLELMGNIRKKILITNGDSERHKYTFNKLLESDLLNLIKDNNIAKIDVILGSVLGSGYVYKELIEPT